MKKVIAIVIATIMATSMGGVIPGTSAEISPIAIEASADSYGSFPNVSESKPLMFYSDGQYTTYYDQQLTNAGGWIDEGDLLYIYEITSTYIRVSYPTPSGRRVLYTSTEAILGSCTDVRTATGDVTVYKYSSGSSSLGYFERNDTVYVLDSWLNGRRLVIYNVGSAGNPSYWKCGWASDSAVDAYTTSSSNSYTPTQNSSGNMDIDALLSYRDQYWSSYNPDFTSYKGRGGDCANYASELLYFSSSAFICDNEWYPDSYCWINVDGLYSYLTGHMGAEVIYYPDASDCDPGDVIYTSTSHVMVVVKVADGKVYATGHTNDRYESYQPTIWRVVKTSQL